MWKEGGALRVVLTLGGWVDGDAFQQSTGLKEAQGCGRKKDGMSDLSCLRCRWHIQVEVVSGRWVCRSGPERRGFTGGCDCPRSMCKVKKRAKVALEEENCVKGRPKGR